MKARVQQRIEYHKEEALYTRPKLLVRLVLAVTIIPKEETDK